MRPPDVVVSPAGIIHVLGYTPTEGEPGAPISVRIHFNPEFSDAIYVRLVLDAKPVPTTVRELHDTSYGRWQLDTLAPPFDPKVFPSPKVLVSVQALDRDKNVLDTATFGEFAYWTPGSSPSACRERPLAHHKPKLHINTNNPRPSQNVTFRRQGSSHIPTPSPTSPGASRSVPSTCKSQVQLHRRTKADSMTRHKNGKHTSDPHVQTPILDLVTSLQDICTGWTSAEVSGGRRLVRFTKVQDGRRLIVSCEPIKVEDYRDSDSVISCIYREESETCYVTSVDIIFLLERLTNSDFPVEEKNRIRRNLEGLRPTTVSKHKHGFEDFFQRIMEFPDPKPRNIEKDLKVFEWSLLDQALDKILSKYTVDTSAVSVEDSESSEPSASSSSDDPDYRQQLTYPPAKSENPYVPDDNPATALGSVRPPSSSASSKFEHIQEDFHFLTSSEDSLCSPLQPPPSYPIYSAEVAHHQAGGSSSGSWSSDYKHNDSIIEQFSPYEVAQHTGQVINYTEIDFNAYESLAFHSSIPGETLDMADNPYI